MSNHLGWGAFFIHHRKGVNSDTPLPTPNWGCVREHCCDFRCFDDDRCEIFCVPTLIIRCYFDFG